MFVSEPGAILHIALETTGVAHPANRWRGDNHHFRIQVGAEGLSQVSQYACAIESLLHPGTVVRQDKKDRRRIGGRRASCAIEAGKCRGILNVLVCQASADYPVQYFLRAGKRGPGRQLDHGYQIVLVHRRHKAAGDLVELHARERQKPCIHEQHQQGNPCQFAYQARVAVRGGVEGDIESMESPGEQATPAPGVVGGLAGFQ